MPNLERTLVRQFEMPNETDRAALDRMCSSYGFVASKFLFAFQTRELRREVKDFRAFRNRLVTALSRAPVEFNQKLAGLRANGKTAEATLLTLLRELKETSGPHLQARHLKLALEETSKMAMTHWKSVIAESKKELADTLKRFHDQDRHYAYWLLCGINRQFFELLDGRGPGPESGSIFRSELLPQLRSPAFFEDAPVQSPGLSGGQSIEFAETASAIRERKLFTTELTLIQAAIRSDQQKMLNSLSLCRCSPVKGFALRLKR